MSASDAADRFNITVPTDDLKDRDVVFKVTQPKNKNGKSTFLSYSIGCNYTNMINLGKKRAIHVKVLIKILEDHGMTKDTPKIVTHDPDSGEVITSVIDWKHITMEDRVFIVLSGMKPSVVLLAMDIISCIFVFMT
jgi:hypothetical protein